MKRRIVISTIMIIVYIIALISFLFISCSRDNPFDINSAKYIPGKSPHVSFTDSLISGYLLDTVKIKISWADTAIGGKPGAIKNLYIDWNGDGQFSDTVKDIQTNPLVISKLFQPQNNIIRIKAIDFDGDSSTVDSAWLHIKPSTPLIDSVEAPATIAKGTAFTIKLNSTDTGGTITSYLWAVDEKTFSRTTEADSLTLSFDSVGEKTIQIKARDNKKIESAIRIITINVVDPSDTVGPQISFLSPLKADTVHSRQCVVSLQVTDASGVSGVTLNNTTACQKVGLTWRGTIYLSEGANILTATAIDTKGYKSEDTIQIWYTAPSVDQTPPVVTLLSPENWIDTINTGSLIVKLLAQDESEIASVSINNEPMNFDPKDSSYSIIRQCNEGLNLFVIRSIDQKGNTRIDSLSVFQEKGAVDKDAPAIKITQPGFLQHIADSVVTVRGYVNDASGIAAVKVNGIDAVVNYPDWSATCLLKRGYDTISVMAIDSSVNRNSSEKSVVVIHNQRPQFTEVPKDTFIPLNSHVTFSASAADDDSSVSFSLKRSTATYGTITPLVSNLLNTTFTYAAEAVGSDTFNLFATDEFGDIDTTTWRVVVLSPTDSTPQFITAAKDLPSSITVLDTCRATVHALDPHGKAITYSIVNSVLTGLVIDELTGKITLVPVTKDTGEKVITIQASNGHQVNTLTWHITVLSQDMPPKLSFLENQTINENQKLQLTLNATDINKDQLEFSFGPLFPVGATLDSNKFSWTPTFSDAGTHTVVFIVKERNRTPSLADTQTITITVNNVNQKPKLVNPGTIIGVVNSTLSCTLSATDPDNDPVSYSMANAPYGAILTGNKFTWTPSLTDIGIHLVKFIASDAALFDTIIDTIKINRVNEAPSLTNPGNKTIYENQLLQFTLSATDPNNDSLIYSMENSPNGAKLNGNTFSWQPTYTQAGSYAVRFIVRDNINPPMSDTETITISVKDTNAPPVLTSPGDQIVSENSQLSFNLSATDVDSNSLTFSMTNAPQGATLSGNKFTWTPTYDQANTYKLTFFVADNGKPSLKDSQSITITVSNVNRPPIIADSSAQSVNENTHINFQIRAYDPDVTNPRFISTNLPSGATLDSYGQFNWTPNYNQAGSYKITFIVQDTSNPKVILSDTANITITVNNVNRPPFFTDSTAKTGSETQIISFQLAATDPDDNKLSYTSTNLPRGATLTPAGIFSWHTSLSDAGTYYVRFVVLDSSDAKNVLSDTATIKITVTNFDPTMPSLLSPVDNELLLPTTVTFRWKNASSATTGYFIQIATDTGFTKIFFQDSTLTDTVKTVSGLANGTKYYWRVNGLNPGGKSGWTPRRSFTTIQTFSLTLYANNGNVAATPAPGPYDFATVVKLKATPDANYHFTGWSGDIAGIPDTVSVVMNSAKTITANFAINTHTLNVSYGTGGTITTPAQVTVNHGASTIIAAKASPGYRFANWTFISGSNNATLGKADTFSTTVTLIGDASVKANFFKTYVCTVSTDIGGIITVPKTSPVIVDSNSTTQISVSIIDGYRFVNWIISGNATVTTPVITPTSVTSSVTVKGDANIKANFVKRVTLSVSAAPVAGGSITTPSSSITLDSGTTTTIAAHAKIGYRFGGWTVSGNATVTSIASDSTSVTVNGDATVQANFVRLVTLRISEVPDTVGSITTPSSSTVTLDNGATTTIAAHAKTGYRFGGWTVSGNATVTSNASDSTSITVNGDATVQANFVRLVTLRISEVPDTVGSITTPSSSSVTLDNGATTTIAAHAKTGYRFGGWTVSGNATVTSNASDSTSITVNGDATVQANFVRLVTLRIGEVPDTIGSITTPSSSSVTLDNGATTTIAAHAKTGYRFDSWTVSGNATVVSTESDSTSITVNGDATIKANFIKIVTLTIFSGIDGTSKIITIDSGTSTTISDPPSDGYHFVKWTKNNDNAIIGHEDSDTTTITLNGNDTIQSNFELNNYTAGFVADGGGTIKLPDGFTVTTKPGEAGTPDTSQITVINGKSIIIEANSPDGTSFSGWTGMPEDKVKIETDVSNPLKATITFTGDATVTANFLPTTEVKLSKNRH